MDEIMIVNNVKKEFYALVMQFYNDYSVNKTSVRKDIYTRMLDLYKKINKCKSLNDINSCLSDIQNELKKLKEIHSVKASEYEKLDKKAKVHEANILLTEIKDITKVAQALTDSYSIIKAMISRLSKGVVKKTEIVPKKDEAQKPKKVVNVEGIDFNIAEINQIQDLTTKIISLKEKLSSLDAMSSDAIAIRKQISDLCNQRMQIAFNLFGYDGINYLRGVESLETRYSNFTEQKEIAPIEMEHDKYLDELNNVIYIIGDLKFNGISSKYVKFDTNASNNDKLKAYQDVYSKYINQYVSLINSLYGISNPVIFSGVDYSVTSLELLSYLSIYNLSGGFQAFKDHHKSGKVGNEAISKELYTNGVSKVEGFINSFKSKCSEMIKKNGNKVIVRTQVVKKEDVKFEMDQKMADLYRMITKKQQTKSK